MALGTGSIRFSRIVSEFGGVSPHRFSEYYVLNGLGVSGIPASGLMRFSNFRGKSNQVTTQQWVTSGYNQESWVRRYNGSGTGISYTWQNNNQRYGWYIYNRTGYGRQSGIFYCCGDPFHTPYRVGSSTYYYGNFKHSTGSMTWSNDNNRDYRLVIDEKVTTWVDTSSYVSATITANIST